MGMSGTLISLSAAKPEENSELAISYTPLICLQMLVNNANERGEVAAQKVLRLGRSGHTVLIGGWEGGCG